MKKTASILCFALFTIDLLAQNFTPGDPKFLQTLDQEVTEVDDFFQNVHPGDVINFQNVLGVDRLDSLYDFTWDRDNKEWQLLERIIYVTDDRGNILSELSTRWDELQWINQNFNLYVYDENNNLVNHMNQVWNGTGWDNSYQFTYTFDANNDLSYYLYQLWDGTVWVNHLQYFYTFDANHLLINWISQVWQSTDWINQFQIINTYDANHLLTISVIQNWITNWENKTQYIYTYDSDQNLTIQLNQNWVSGEWQDNNRNVYAYDANHNRTLILGQIPAGADTWVDEYRYIYAFDLYNNVIGLLSQYYINDVWTNGEQFLETYDEFQNQITDVYQIWENEWINQDSTHYYYTISTGIKDLIHDESGLSIYPNPATTFLNINLDRDFTGDVTLEIYSNTGIKVMETKINSAQNKTLDTGHLLPGSYHVVIHLEKGLTIRNFVKL